MKLFIIALAAVLLQIACAGPVAALDPTRSLNQYKHTRWTIDDGAPGYVSTLAQDRSGFLWMGGREGLFRFDGLSFELIKPRKDEARSVSSLLVAANGEVWVGHGGAGGTSVYRHGELADVPMPNPAHVMDLVQTPDGSIWAMLGRSNHQIMRFDKGSWKDVGDELGFPVEGCIKMIVARDGAIWITTLKTLLHLPVGARRFEKVDVSPTGHASLAEDANGNVWMSDAAGSRVVNGTGARRAVAAYPTPTATRKVSTIFDREGALWGISDDGLFRVVAPRPSGPGTSMRPVVAGEPRDGRLLSAKPIGLLADREGNLWVATSTGLERFRDARVVSAPPLTKTAFWGDALFTADDGTVYVGESDAVYRIRPGEAPKAILREESQAICGAPDGAIWIVLQDRLVRLSGGRFSTVPGVARARRRVIACLVDRRGRIWLGADTEGLLLRSEGAWRQVGISLLPAKFDPSALLLANDGRVLVVVDTRLIAIRDASAVEVLISGKEALGRLRTLQTVGDEVWVGARNGLARLENGRLDILSAKRLPMLRNTAGIVASPTGESWLSAGAGIVRMRTEAIREAWADPAAPVAATLLDYRDGVGGVQSSDSIRALVQGRDGRLWASNETGTVLIDPTRLHHNALAPPTSITLIRAGQALFRDPRAVRLAAGTPSLEVDFAAPSLRIPERVRVRYQLVGVDPGWVEAGRRRQAFYTGLKPGRHVFRVIAANDDGVWNHTGSRVTVELPPTFLQSGLFKALCVVALASLLWLIYRLRVGQLSARIRGKLEERLAERERIARDLHDTLLQGFQGLILRFQSIANHMPTDDKVRRLIEQALESADAVLSEGRDSVRQLRARENADLAEGFREKAEQLRLDHPLEFVMTVEGTPRRLHPIVRSEVSRIGDEALLNAFRHSRGTKVELSISYRPTGLFIGIRDDGVGIDPVILKSGGRQGHFGLVGMRERAQQIRTELLVSSRAGGGLEVQIMTPHQIAFADERRRFWSGWVRFVQAPATA